MEDTYGDLGGVLLESDGGEGHVDVVNVERLPIPSVSHDLPLANVHLDGEGTGALAHKSHAGGGRPFGGGPQQMRRQAGQHPRLTRRGHHEDQDQAATIKEVNRYIWARSKRP